MANFSILVYTVLIFIINLISIFCHIDNDAMSKLVACMEVLSQKFKGVPNDEVYSPMMLKCFITISDSKVKTILTDIEAGIRKISPKEINKLTDINTLKKIPESILKKKANELEKALKDFNKLHEQFEGARDGDMDDDQMDYDDDDYDDDYFQNEHQDRIHFLGLIPKGLKGIFKVFKNYISLFFFFALVYVSLWTLRKISEPDEKKKIKRKLKKKRKM